MTAAKFDVVIVGAGAAGLFCGIEAAQRGRHVCVVDHANKAGKKILMSGGGRCNFTNLDVGPEHFLSENPHFCRSALSRYTQWDFIAWINRAGIPYHEKSLGQLFCDHSAKDIQQQLLKELQCAGAELRLDTTVKNIQALDTGFSLMLNGQLCYCEALVIATGGLSIPTMGATDFGFRVAAQFGHQVLPYRASLVPYTWNNSDKSVWSALSGISLPIVVSSERSQFHLDALITHRGLSGPAMLQISNYWQPGESLTINWLPNIDVSSALAVDRHQQGKKQLKNWLGHHLPMRLAEFFTQQWQLQKTLAELSKSDVERIATALNAWTFMPGGTEGYRTAEVTLGGVDTAEVSSKTLGSHRVPGLYFIGEVLDVTGWLGGYNFQWAWSSGWAAGQVC